MKFKKGQKVLIRKDLEASKQYDNCTVTIAMKQYKGQIAIITRTKKYGIFERYELNIDGGRWSWASEMLIPTNISWRERYKIMP